MRAADSNAWRPAPALVAGAVHVWLCDVDALSDQRLLDSCRALLDADETLRLQRFAFDTHRHRFLVSHALLRTVLSLYGGGAPAQWRFERGVHGKPRLVAAQRGSAPMFNLSHSGSLAALALSRDTEALGIDIEFHRPGRSFLALARRNFAPAEYAGLPELPPEDLVPEFYDLWTLKEAFVKARGDGLTQSLADFWFTFDRPSGHVAFDARAALEPEPARWRFWSYRLAGPYSAAVALRGTGTEPHLEPRWFRAVPGRSWGAMDTSSVVGSRRITAN